VVRKSARQSRGKNAILPVRTIAQAKLQAARKLPSSSAPRAAYRVFAMNRFGKPGEPVEMPAANGMLSARSGEPLQGDARSVSSMAKRVWCAASSREYRRESQERLPTLSAPPPVRNRSAQRRRLLPP